MTVGWAFSSKNTSREFFFPPAKGFKNAIQQPWEKHVSPPRNQWLCGVDGAADIGIQRLPPMDHGLATALAEFLRLHQSKGKVKPEDVCKGYNLNYKIPSTIKVPTLQLRTPEHCLMSSPCLLSSMASPFSSAPSL